MQMEAKLLLAMPELMHRVAKAPSAPSTPRTAFSVEAFLSENASPASSATSSPVGSPQVDLLSMPGSPLCYDSTSPVTSPRITSRTSSGHVYHVYPCTRCDLTFDARHKRDNHARKVHQLRATVVFRDGSSAVITRRGPNALYCCPCGRQLKTATGLQSHAKACSGKLRNPSSPAPLSEAEDMEEEAHSNNETESVVEDDESTASDAESEESCSTARSSSSFQLQRLL